MSNLRKRLVKQASNNVEVIGYEGSIFDSGDLIFQIKNDGRWKSENDVVDEEVYPAIKQWIVDNIDKNDELFEVISDAFDETDEATLKQKVLNADGEWSYTLV